MTQTTPSHSQSVEAAEAHIVQLVREFADDYAESGPSSTKANAVWAAIKAAFNPCSPTVADVEAAVGMSAGAWDCVAPEKIIAAVIELTGRRAELTSQQEVAAPGEFGPDEDGIVWPKPAMTTPSPNLAEYFSAPQVRAMIAASRVPVASLAEPNPLIPWRGTTDSYDGPLPQGAFADLKFRNGEVCCGCRAWEYSWRDRGEEDDIVAYRIATPAPEQATTGSGQADRLKSAFDEGYGLGHRDGMEDCRPMGGSGYGLESCWEDSETRAAILSTASPAGEGEVKA